MAQRTNKYIQYSKKLVTAIMIVWCVIRVFSVLASFLKPEIDLVGIVRGIDEIAMVNVLAYTGNSVSEKIAVQYFNSKKTTDSDDEDDDDDNEETNNG